MHRQIAIVFKTPPYQDQNITEEVDVNVALRRISDQMESEPVTFTYLPYNPGQKHNALSGLWVYFTPAYGSIN